MASTDRASVFVKPQISAEATPGTRVTPSKTLPGFDFTFDPDPMVNTSKPNGYLFPTVGVTNYEQTKFTMKAPVATFDEMGWFWAGLFAAPSIATPGGGTNSREWTHNVSSTTVNSRTTLSAEWGDTIRAASANYMFWSEGGYTVDFDKGLQLSGAGFAQKWGDNLYTYVALSGSPTSGTWSMSVTAGGSTQTASGLAKNITAGALQTALEALSNVGAGQVTCSGGALGSATIVVKWGGTFLTTVTPPSAVTVADTFDTGDVLITFLSPDATAVPLIPVAGSYFDIYTASAQSGLAGATALTRCFGVEFKVSNRAAPVKPLATANSGTFATDIETTPQGTFKFSVGADSNAFAYLTTLRQNSKLFARVKATGPLIEGSLNYLFQHDLCLILTKFGAVKDAGGILQLDIEGVVSHDSTWGRATSVLLRNTQTAL